MKQSKRKKIAKPSRKLSYVEERHKEFARELVANGGNRRAAYLKVYGGTEDDVYGASASANRLLKREDVRGYAAEALRVAGLDEGRVADKMSVMIDAEDKEGEKLWGVQFRTTRLAAEILGMTGGKGDKASAQTNSVTVNYNLGEGARLDGVLEKLNAVTAKLGLGGYPKGKVIDAEYEPGA